VWILSFSIIYSSKIVIVKQLFYCGIIFLFVGQMPSLAQKSDIGSVLIEWNQPMNMVGLPGIVGVSSDRYFIVDGGLNSSPQELRLGLGKMSEATYYIVDRQSQKVKHTLMEEEIRYNDTKLFLTGNFSMRGNNLVIYYGGYSAKNDAYFLYSRMLDGNGVLSPFEQMLSIDVAFRSMGNVAVEFSKDKSKLLVQGISTDKKEGSLHYFLLYDKEGKLIWEGKWSLKVDNSNSKSRKYTIQSLKVTNEGMVYFLVLREKEKPDGLLAGDKYNYSVVRLNTALNISYTDNIELDAEETIHDLKIEADVAQGVGSSVVGVYSVKKYNNVRGTFEIHLTDGPKLSGLSKLRFKGNFINEMYPRKKEIRGVLSSKKTLNDSLMSFGYWVYRETLLLKDGSRYMFFEDSYYQGISSGSNVTWSYLFNDLYVQHIGEDGRLIKTVHIPKGQYSYDDRGMYCGYFALLKGDMLYVVFNDDPRNEEFWSTGEGDMELARMPKDAKLRMVSMSSDGILKYHNLDKLNKNGVLFVPSSLYNVPGNTEEFFVVGVMSNLKGKCVIGKLAFQNN